MEFRVLGPVEVVGDGAAIALGGLKQRALLAELLLSRGAIVPRERLVDALWGDRPPPSAQSSLQVYVHGLRRAVGADRVETRGSSYRVCVEPDEFDLVRFERLLARGRRALADGAPAEADEALDAALGLWRGEALADLGDSPVRSAASGLEELRRQAFELRIDARLALGEHDEVIALLEELILDEPYRERLREQLITALYRAGRQRDALAAYQDARRTLADELGVEPGPQLRELERAILRHDEALLSERRAPTARPTLPVSPTPLVGRRLELAALEAMVRGDGARLVTLTGPGGTGKTRLALAAAEQIANGSRDGAVFVDLSSIHDAELIPGTVASALGVDDPREVESRLRDSSLVLVLDNLEQMAETAAPIVATLLERAPRLRILATSRIPLRVRGEQEYPVEPLPVADPGRPFEVLAGNEAIALFAARTVAVDPAFELTPRNAQSVARVCARLDGLPLAIELAAARARTLPVDQLERRLERALDLLVGGARDLPPRQRTLRATLDWSFELLEEDARVLLPRVAVFAGGFALESLEALGGDASLPALDALLEASLVRRRGDRFDVLETIREYALGRLTVDEEAALRAQHAAHFLEVAEAAWEGILAGDEAEADGMRALDAETENLRAAFDHALASGDDETGVRLAIAQRWYWMVRGRIAEGRAAFAWATSVDIEPVMHAAALNGSATFAKHQGDIAAAREQWEEALATFRAHGDGGEAARCYAELGGVAVADGDLRLAYAMYEEAAELFCELGQPVREAIAVSNLAAIAADLDDLEASVSFGERAIEVQRGLRDWPDLAVSLANLAPTELRRGNLEVSRALLEEAVRLAEEYGYQLLLAHAVAVAAELAAVDGEAELAARLVGAAEAAFPALGGTVPEGVHLAFARIFARIGDERSAQLEAGRALSVDDALGEARHLFSGD
jgi:predicted ATPase/DNA-binding SARP family transcriptional activator